MKNLSLDDPGVGPLRVLCLGAHSDDLEIGCGGTLLSLFQRSQPIEVLWTVFSANGERKIEAEESAGDLLGGVEDRKVELLGFRDGFFPSQRTEIKEWFEGAKAGFRPDLIFTHREGDRHQDHRLISELTWNTFRDHLILEYEIPKYDGDLGNPTVFVPLSDEVRRRKVSLLLDKFSSQRNKHWFAPETFNGLMRIRGLESASPTGYAEAFYARKVRLDLGLSKVPTVACP